MTSLVRNALIAIAAIALPAGIATAAPLCRESKGQFTPCTKAQLRAMPEKRHADDSKPGKSGAAHKAVPDRLGPFRTTKLCRESKGQFTPCPK